MKRIQLFEFEDFRWFPAWLRSCMTNLIVLLQRMMGTDKVLADLISAVLVEKKLSQIVDLGSGSGGVMPNVFKHLREQSTHEDLKLIMTDLYPNNDLIKRFNADHVSNVTYFSNSVDATNIATAPAGLKTMVNSFHHMPPESALKILKSAQQNHQPLLIYEMAENKMPLLVWWLLLPISLAILMIMVLFMTPFVRPLTWQQIVFTYLIPIIPICYAWDGQASLPRMYSFDDMEQLLEGLTSESYTWTKGHALKNNKKQGIYLMGLPN